MTDRRHALNDKPAATDGACVIYVMARDQRVQDNYALVAAQQEALDHKVPLIVVFCLQPKTGHRANEHYRFMLDGLERVEKDLAAKTIPFHLEVGAPSRTLPDIFASYKPAAVYFDFSPLRGPQEMRTNLAERLDCAVYEVDTHNTVPLWAASEKQESAARTIRPKIMRQLWQWADEDASVRKHPYEWSKKVQSFNDMKSDIVTLLKHVPANGTDISRFKPGERAAHKALDNFLRDRLRGYASGRNDPAADGQSELNPYLHYGQLMSLRVVRAVEAAAQDDGSLREDADALIEEMVVRKELSDNFCYYQPDYDRLKAAPDWARKTLEKHADDERSFTYTRQQFDDAETHDDAWNAAQMQLRKTGKIHGYMRMYWAKKVLEWSASPQDALDTLLYLNDFYHIDGGDPNGYVGILWSIAGLHDRPWFERPVYGQVRYMNANGLKRKFKIDTYIDTYVDKRVGLDG